MTPYEEGQAAKSIFENPYWKEWPKPAAGGQQEEENARRFVDGYYSKL